MIDPDSNHFDFNVAKFKSYDIDSFIDSPCNISNSFSVFHHNSRSISGKLGEYELFFKSLKDPFDILIFTETWLKTDNVDNCNFEGYKSVHLLRPIDKHIDFKNVGGGISIYIKYFF